MMRGSFIVVAALFVAGCGGGTDPAPAGDPAPTLSTLRDKVFANTCTVACHSGGEFAAGGLDMSKDLHAALVGVACSAPQCAGQGQRVVAGDADKSLLYMKVRAKMDNGKAPCGETMPMGLDAPALPADDVDLIRRWIEGGALDD